MEVHAFSGFFSENMKTSRTAGILAALTETYPSMTWDDVLQWAHENALDEWVPNIDTDDAQPNSVRLVGSDGFINFDDRYPWTAEAQSNFSSWAKGYDIGKLPPIQTASPAIQQVFTQPAPAYAPPAPQPAPADDVTDWDFFQQTQDDPTLPAAQPAPTPTQTYTQANQPAPIVTPAPMPIPPSPKPTAKKEGGPSMLLIVGGLLAAYMIMKRKK